MAYGSDSTRRVIKNFAYFDSLPTQLKQDYIDTVQRTYHVSLQAIGRQMKGAMSSFDNYLMDVGVHGNRREASRKTSPLWSAFCMGAADIYGRPVYDEEQAKPAPPKRDPAHLEITGAPKSLLDILSVVLTSPDILDASRYRVTIQEIAS